MAMPSSSEEEKVINARNATLVIVCMEEKKLIILSSTFHNQSPQSISGSEGRSDNILQHHEKWCRYCRPAFCHGMPIYKAEGGGRC